ncbi:P-loop NTPase family protein [Jeotgalibacillus campisalis]|uniref:NACHT domain-containing protein n=1 Tax=Jeotgalibacillus campisalis TaxID=220754 RepID=A0A0C2VPI9_9BACL|nr:ATP-binding protein [Jeotgalibacillus campisalis]KIL50827.1 hypothetical protein KR50_07080 [Jeotgalibacillus campisalis]
MENELVRYSRAGDVFHYRWAARRCLQMIYPNSKISSITIEGSKESESAGEYVIDVAEYSNSKEGEIKNISYYQLKHTSVRADKPFILSDLKGTIEGFAERYSARCGSNHSKGAVKISFTIVTNRPIADNFKQNIDIICSGGIVNSGFSTTLQKYTKLKGEHLKEFCALLHFVDGEGDYNEQKYSLHSEISQLIAGTVDNAQIESITSLVRDKALPNTDGIIIREEILKRFGVSAEGDLYPAPPELEELKDVIPRQHHDDLIEIITNSPVPIIIHAAGGIGKSVFAQNLARSLPNYSFGVVYDCFGGGRYRNRSTTRHRYRDALVQISNELAAQGLCDPLLPQSTALEDEILRSFLVRVKSSINSLRKTNMKANLVIIIDAADNAEMAAEEFSHSCFAKELLKESFPEGCILVELCRTERVYLLNPSHLILQIELKPFSSEETLNNLRQFFPEAKKQEAEEFHRLTNGNPRVQANALSREYHSVIETLKSLGPSSITVEDQIDAQLHLAVSSLKEIYPTHFQEKINTICVSLATLPPFIPLDVISVAAEVDEATVRSFVADLGRPLWITDTSVQFRDEPTETWFRENFSANVEQIKGFVKRLKPLAYKYSYVAEALPSLLLQSEQYEELMELALSQEFIPKENPINRRNILVYRLQFAFKAALKVEKHEDAIKLALLAGEEVAGDRRQFEILKDNIDLIPILLNNQKVQELAYGRKLYSGWEGSENVYSASLLSCIRDCHGESRGYLRSAHNWLKLYFEDKSINGGFSQRKLQDEDILELAFTHLNLHGVNETIKFIVRWRPNEISYRITSLLAKRLIDIGDFKTIFEMLQVDSRNQYLVIALVHELLEVGKLASVETIETCLDLLTVSRVRIPMPSYSYNNNIKSALLSFLEVCYANNLPKEKILRVIRHYFDIRGTRTVTSNFNNEDRSIYFRSIALRSLLDDNNELKMDMLLPEDFTNKKQNYNEKQEVQEFKEIIGALLPWYIIRAQILLGDKDGLQLIEQAEKKSREATNRRYKDYDMIPFEISHLLFEVLKFYNKANQNQVNFIFDSYLEKNSNIRFKDYLKATYFACRLDHLSGLVRKLEQISYQIVKSESDEGPEMVSSWFIDLARALLPISRDDAAAYFDLAIEAVSKFGDEIVERWDAVVSIANQASLNGQTLPELAYRFIRVAELVGDNVAREKYFNRDEAIKVSAKLSPVSSLASLSRWRDRYKGSFDRQLPALIHELVQSENLDPSVGWSTSSFIDYYKIEDFAVVCIEKEKSLSAKRKIFECAYRDIRVNDTTQFQFQKLRQFVSKYSFDTHEIYDAIDSFSIDEQESKKNSIESLDTSYKECTWVDLFDGIDLTLSHDINELIQRYDNFKHNAKKHIDPKVFWQEIYKRVSDNDTIPFLRELIIAENADFYDCINGLSYMPKEMRNRIGVKRVLPEILHFVARRYANYLTGHGTLEFFMTSIKVERDLQPFIVNGILDGLTRNSELIDASTLFGFINIAASIIDPSQAMELLEFGLSRFEQHISEDYADGNWSESLTPPENINVAFTGFIWSALGAPESKIRWQAAHAVRRLAEANCVMEISHLIRWMENGQNNAFVSKEFPFYDLHAQLYFLIALAKVSKDHPKVIKSHFRIFTKYALEGTPHILIRKFAAEISLNIENAFPNTLTNEIVYKLRQVGVSPFPLSKESKYGVEVESYFHEIGQVDTSVDFSHGYDMEKHWFERLGNVFGVSEDQIVELVNDVIINEWGIDNNTGDPRYRVWNSNRKIQTTYHDHGSYPHTDTYGFYLSYHAMFVVAGKLLEKMPIIKRNDWCDNEWEEWLQSHLLTRGDGGWLADRRDLIPLKNYRFIEEDSQGDWHKDIITNDFLNILLDERKDSTWLNVFGSWLEGDTDKEDTFSISTAFVNTEVSQSLLNALSSCSNPNDYKLPEYQEERMELSLSPFNLKGWIWRENIENNLDEKDPHAANINYPPYQIGKTIADKLGLTPDDEKRNWYISNEKEKLLDCEIWSNITEYDEEPSREGNKLSAKLSFLIHLCNYLEIELIIEIQINRRYKYKSYMMREEKHEYKPPQSKILILGADGRLRDETTYYELRESNS